MHNGNHKVQPYLQTRSPEHALIIRSAKGNKDRIVPLPQCVLSELEVQLRVARAVLKRDVAAGLPVAIPTALAVKYPKAPLQEQWAWVFPAQAATNHPRTGLRVRGGCMR